MLFELVLVRVWVAIESKEVDFDVGSIAICELAILTDYQTRSVGILIGI